MYPAAYLTYYLHIFKYLPVNRPRSNVRILDLSSLREAEPPYLAAPADHVARERRSRPSDWILIFVAGTDRFARPYHASGARHRTDGLLTSATRPYYPRRI